MEENKQVRVDNWGVFFLQRLQLFFNKTDFCDLTLQFAGNVQLKVHRLVLNVCTEYFDLLERSDRLIDENVILMPEALQPDVVVPIINFMYTGLLDYPQDIYNRLCQAADLMNISVLTKLLDAQKPPALLNKSDKVLRPKVKEVKPEPSSNTFSQVKKPTPKIVSSEYPSPTVSSKRSSSWKRKTTSSSNSSFSCRSDPMHRNNDPLALDEAKPTRFEWPEDDLELSNLDMMDMSGFGDISYNSKPLLREDEVKPILSKGDSKSELSKDTVHEIHFDDRSNVYEPSRNGVEKRKADTSLDKSPKRIRIVESENDTTISVIANENSSNFDPTKIVSEILKKYPHLVKKKKNIKLKIIAKTTEKEAPKVQSSLEKTPTEKTTVKTVIKKVSSQKLEPEKPTVKGSVWTCKECVSQGEPMEFALYYLYRKHMTDVHSTKFDPRICKYCGIAFSRNEQHSYHLFTKHGIKPSGGQSFPSCSLCPYVALSKEALQVHESKHEKTEMQCSSCKLAFTSSDAIASHLQITGHMGKIKKNVYDCQYCTKTSQSSISLLSHIKSNHEAEGKRDGIISLDEVDLEVGDDILTDAVEEQEPVEAFIPETQKTKVNIISDVTVPVSKAKTAEPVRLDQTKGHVSVPTSIATSLGLLDIVVLDENQQFILHNQTQQAGTNQTEYILPQIDARNVTAEGLPSNDELVMVLTDQDYKDGHSGIATDNSNIVVLYSHPADGQQGQFITSQGNIMVNSETGLLEIRNGAAIATTSANQIVMNAPADNHIETIEMIQREIEGGHDLKQESFYERQKPKELEQTQEPVDYIENQQVEVQSQPSLEKEIMETSEEVIHEEVKSESENTIAEQEVSASNPPTLNDSVEEQTSMETSTEQLEQSTQSEISEACEGDSKDMIPMEIDTSLSEENPSVDTEGISKTDHIVELPDTHLEETISSSENITEKMQQEVIMKTAEVEQGTIVQNEDEPNIDDEDHKLSVDEKDFSMDSDETEVEDQEETILEPIPEEKIEDKNDTGEIESSDKKSPSTVEREEGKPYSPTDKPVDMDCEEGTEQKEKQVTEPVNINSIEITQPEKDKDNQECMISSQSTEIIDNEEETDKQSECTKGSTTMSILDDWEDTDSQQSDNKMKSIKKGAQETVHKLMDDWDEEEVEK